jgi:hypothetical protein
VGDAGAGSDGFVKSPISALRGFRKCVVCQKIEGWEAGGLGGLKQNLLCHFFSLLAFQPPSLQPIVALADGSMIVF